MQDNDIWQGTSVKLAYGNGKPNTFLDKVVGLGWIPFRLTEKSPFAPPFGKE